jgi:endonuclease/exonuclease/phosphatase family metal-dependent hydrolase
MYLLTNKKINIWLLLFGLGLFVQTQSICVANGHLPYTVYGTVTGKEYQNQEELLGFNENQAFPGDEAYSRTIVGHGRSNFCVAESAVPPKFPNTLRIMSFNVHNFHKICAQDGELKKHPKYAVAAIKSINPDIVALEEIVPYVSDDKIALAHITKGSVPVNFSMLDGLMRDIGFTHNIKINDFERHTDQLLRNTFLGKAIYTKSTLPIKAFSNSQIGSSPDNDRSYVSILFEYKGKRILLYDVHLTFFNDFVATFEISELMAFIQKDKEKFGTENVVIIGDFNNNPYTKPDIFEPLKKASYTLLNDMKPTAFNQNTQTGETIDLIYVSDGFLNNFEILNTASTEYEDKKVVVTKSDASDHWPVFFDFKSRQIPLAPAKLHDSMQMAKIDASVNRIFGTIKSKVKPLMISDVELKEAAIALPIPKETQSQSLSQIRVYEKTEIIDKGTIDQLLEDAKKGSAFVSQEYGDEVESVTEPDKAYLSKVVLNVLDNEIKLQDENYVVYHAYNPRLTILFDVYQQIYRWGLLNKEQPLALRLIEPYEFNGAQQALENLLTQAAALTRDESGEYVFEGEKSRVFDLISKISSLLLSVNLSLFGNMESKDSSSFILGLASFSFRKIKAGPKLAQILKDCNIGQEFVPKILRLQQQFLSNQKKGVLLQISIKKGVIDNVAYLSNLGGRPMTDNIVSDAWDAEKKRMKVSSFLEHFIKKPQELNVDLKKFTDVDGEYSYGVDQIQARLWMPAPELYDPRFIMIKRYYFDPNDYVDEVYYEQLNRLVEKIIKSLIRNKLLNQIGQHGFAKTPLETFEREILKDLGIEESKKIRGRLQELGAEETVRGKPREFKSLEMEVEDLFDHAGRQKTIDIKLGKKITNLLASPLYRRALKNLPGKVTPLMIATKMNSLPLASFLLSIKTYDPEFNVRDINGHTALYWVNVNSSSHAGKEILKHFTKYVEIHPKLLDSMLPADMVIFAKVASVKPIILKKFEEKLGSLDSKVVDIGKALIKNAHESELHEITEKVFAVVPKVKSYDIDGQITVLSLLKFLATHEKQKEENLVRMFDFDLDLTESKILSVQKAALDLRDIIEEEVYAFYEEVATADTSKLETMYQQVKKFSQSNHIYLQLLAIDIFSLIIKAKKANEQIWADAFAIVKRFSDSKELNINDRAVDRVLVLLADLIDYGKDFSRYNDVISEAFIVLQRFMHSTDAYILDSNVNLLYSLQHQSTRVTVDKSAFLNIVKSLVKILGEKFIESDEEFNRADEASRYNIMYGCLYFLRNLILPQDSAFFTVAEKIVQRAKQMKLQQGDALLRLMDDVSKLIEKEKK